MNNLVTKTPMDERLAKIVREPIEHRGFRLVRLRFMSGGKIPTLQIMAERPDGKMEVEDCAKLSRAISAILDVDDPIDGEYNLELSSPGIDRPLTHPDDFSNWLDYEAKIEMQFLVDGRKRYRGRLKGFENGSVILEGADYGTVHLNFDDIVDAKLVLTDDLIKESLRRGAIPDVSDEDIEQEYEKTTSEEEKLL